MAIARITDELPSWNEISRRIPPQDSGLLLGNGASVSIWNEFRYPSLYDIACNVADAEHLLDPDKQIFEHLETRNFEAVLSALIISGKIWQFFGKPAPDVEDLRQSYSRIRKALIRAVRGIHVPYPLVHTELKGKLREFLAGFEYVYSSNYDLLLYWIMMGDSRQFKDFFWTVRDNKSIFDLGDTDLWEGRVTKVLYLHGGLHLFRHNADGTTFKKIAQQHQDLLSLFDEWDDAVPLFISEGTWKDKQSAINRNQYLSFAYERFSKHRGSLVVFGHSLSPDFDQHLLNAINKWRRYDQRRMAGGHVHRLVSISVYPGMGSAEIIALKNRLIAALPQCEVLFFDSTTCPLGLPEIQIPHA